MCCFFLTCGRKQIQIKMSANSFSDLSLESSWQQALGSELEKDYMRSLFQFLDTELAQGKQIFPSSQKVFAALDITPVNAVRVVILGQDPYHGQGQAQGLSFSVLPGVAVPPSLKNIYKELTNDLGFVSPPDGCLNSWAEQGVLLLNSVLTVEAGKAASHQGKGWEVFTDKIIAHLNSEFSNLVFMLWGNYAQRKGVIINREKHLVLTSPHPSPLSAGRGFFGGRHFSKANTYLRRHGIEALDWQLKLTR
jgi:uracil-DNA glycosylase